MPARGQIDHSALPARIRLWLLDHPGPKRPAEVATGLGLPEGMARQDWSRIVANAMGRLAREGALERVDLREQMGWKGPCTGYELPLREGDPSKEVANA